jgi:hypothetical protein
MTEPLFPQWRVRVKPAATVVTGAHDGDLDLVDAHIRPRVGGDRISSYIRNSEWTVEAGTVQEARQLELEIDQLIRRHDLALIAAVEEWPRLLSRWHAVDVAGPPLTDEEIEAEFEPVPPFGEDFSALNSLAEDVQPLSLEHALESWADAEAELFVPAFGDAALLLALRLDRGGTAHMMELRGIHIPAVDEEQALLLQAELAEALEGAIATEVRPCRPPES